MSSRGLFYIEMAAGTVPDTQFFESDSAFKSFGVTRIQRLCGFAGCSALGLVLSLVGAVIGDEISFPILYIIGTIVSLIGTGFLVEFSKQMKLMFKPVRLVATVVFLVMIILFPICDFLIRALVDFPCFVFIFVQYAAFFWYTLSYIPSAQSTVRKVFSQSES